MVPYLQVGSENPLIDTGLTLNYHSIAPSKYKKSVVISFVYRIFRACSTWQQFDIGLNEAMTILRKNQYPDSFFFPLFILL